ncbi:MAG TPA: protein kinase [Gemmatimonadales bacterium]|nr:protein kinase [Gemmatimonadales bacterium]
MTVAAETQLQTALEDRYVIERELGHGGMARVYLARDLRHDRLVALKVLRPEISACLGSDRFLNEIRTVAALQHPNIVPLFDSGTAAGLLYYVMPFVEGETLRQRLIREGSLPIQDAMHIALETADALGYAHARGVVHRDVKPENILLSGGHALVSDFGISRAVAKVAGTAVTDIGVVLGTPAYMSPEQATGQPDVDARSDVYALGCVLYEMLTGEPPFSGSTAQTVLALQVSAPPVSVRVLRPNVPPTVDRVIERALSKVRSDRFEDGAALRRALRVAADEASAKRVRQRAIAFAGAVAASLVAVSIGLSAWSPALDESSFVVAPFVHRSGAVPALFTGDVCEFHLSHVLQGFRGISVASKWRVREAAGKPDEQVGHDGWLDLARELESGRLVEGEVSQRGDTIALTAELWDARRRERVSVARAQFIWGVDDVAAVFTRLGAQLLGVPTDSVGRPVTADVRASAAFVDARKALARWDLAAAELGFRRAVELDPQFADGHLWLGQTLSWLGRPSADWGAAVRRAHTMSDRLSERERMVTEALVALADQDYPQACARYARLVRQDSADVQAWLGLGDCHRLDGAVVRDPRSPTGWAFRASYGNAVQAYRRVLELVPSFGRVLERRAFEPLVTLLPVSPNVLRSGHAVPPDTGWFLAFPTVQGDTVVFVPDRAAQTTARPAPPSLDQAVARNRATFVEIVTRWVRALPQSVDAQTAAALAFETVGQLDPARYGEQSAVAAARRARLLARDADESLRPGLGEVRLRIKIGDLAGARALADSIIRGAPIDDPLRAHDLAALAALTGRVHLTAQLAARAAPLYRDAPGPLADAPLAVLEARERLRAYAAFGAPVDSIRALTRRVDTLLSAWVAGPVPVAMRRQLLDQPMALAFPTLGRSNVHRPDPPEGSLIGPQFALATGALAAARRALDATVAGRANIRPGDVALHRTFHEAWLLAQLGDSAAAATHLERALTPAALETLGIGALDSPVDAAALVRGIALRAQLARSLGQTAAAAEWAARALTLWQNADLELRLVLDSLR